LVCLALTFATFAQAAEDVLSVIPEGALGFAVINRLAETDATLQKVGGRMGLPVPGLLAELEKETGIGPGLDKQGSAAIVLMPGEEIDDEPIVLLYAPVTDYQAFIKPLGPESPVDGLMTVKVDRERFLVGQDGGFAVLGEPRHVDVIKAAIASPNRLSAELAPLKDWLNENSAGLVVTRTGVETLAAVIQKGLREVRAGFADMPPEFRDQMGPAIAVFEVYEKIFVAMDDNVQTYAAAVRADKGGSIHLTERVRASADSGLAKMLDSIETPDGNLLAGLPSGPFVLAAAGITPNGALEALMDFSIEIMKAMPQIYGLEEGQADKLGELSRESMKGLRSMGFLFGVGKPGDPMFGRMFAVMKVDDAKAYMARYRRVIDEMNELVKDNETSFFGGMKVKDVEIEGMPAIEIRMPVPVTPQAQGMPGYDEMMKAMFGPKKRITTYVAVADDHTIVTAYTNKQALAKCIAAIKDPQKCLSADAGVAKTAGMLPDGALGVIYWSPKGTVDLINQLLPAFVPPTEGEFQLPAFPRTPPVGIAVKTAPGEVKSHMVVPNSVLKAIAAYIPKLVLMAAEREKENTLEVGQPIY